MTQGDIVEIRAVADRAAAPKVTVHRITVSGRYPCRIELELRGAKDDAIARRVCSAVSRCVKKTAEPDVATNISVFEIVVEWEAPAS